MKTILNSRNIKTGSMVIAVIFSLSLALSSCKKDGNNNSLSAYVIATNSAQGSAAQDFYLNNNKAASAIAYGSSSDYISASTADKQGSFKNTGTATANTTFNLSLTAGQYYDVFYTEDNSAVTAQNDRTAPDNGKAKIRFINLSSALQTNVDFGVSGGAKLVSAIAYKGASSYYEVDPTSVFALYLSGSSSALLSIPAIIQAGHIYTIYVSGTSSANIAFHVVNEK
ncbi:MAG: DUF4397 domain-containing protein [Bacteroidetes bacterium]|nr:DUF4397 domain-containing protein [Bacteroidota bacterium]